MIRRIPRGDTFQKMAQQFPSPATAYPAPPAPNPRLRDGGILDVDDLHIGNTGNAVLLNNPSVVKDLTGIPSSLWGSSPNIPPEASITTILQANASTPKNPRNLVLNINSLSTQQGENNAALHIDLKVKITFGVGNDQNIAFLDVCQGQQVSLVATNINVEGLFVLMSPLNTLRNFIVGVNLGYGDRASYPSRPTFTARYANLPPTTNLGFVVPPFSKEVFVSAVDETTGLSVPCTVTMLASSTFVISQFSLAAGANAWLPIPNNVRSIVIGNPAANPNDIQGAVIFGLAL